MFSYIVLGLLAFALGAALFSFGNVLVYRVPLGLPFVNARSICPSCKHQLLACDMLPVLGWVALRGRCRFCGAPISPRYPAVELLGGLCALACVASAGFTLQALALLLFLFFLAVVALVDADTMEIPNGFVLALALLGGAACLLWPALPLWQRLVGAVCVSLPMLVLTLVIPGAFGGGDIKLMAACGLFLGVRLCLVAAFLAILGGGAWGAWLLARGRLRKTDHFAFGPFLCAGMALALFVGEPLLQWYLGLVFLS